MILSIRDLRKAFPKKDGEMVAIDNFNLEVKEGEFICILGPSGCGKTTLLRIVAGLETATSGVMLLNDKPIVGPGIRSGYGFPRVRALPLEDGAQER